MTKNITLFLFGLFLVLFQTRAQESLSLQQAIKIGLKNNFSIQIEKQKQELAANNNTLGQAGGLPNIMLGIDQGMSNTNLDNPAGFLRSGNIGANNFNPSLTVNWRLFGGFNAKMTKNRLELLQVQSNGNAMLIVENTVQAIILAYYTALLENERSKVFESSLKLSRDRYNYSKLKKDLGSAVTFDVLKDKNSYLTDSSNYLSQVFNQKNALRNLNLLLGKSVHVKYQFTDILRAVKKDYTLDELHSKMTASNTNLKNQYINLEILSKEINISKSQLYPTIDLNLRSSENWQTQDLSKAVFASGSNGEAGIKSTTGVLSANITLSFTLFNGGRIQSQIKNANIQERIGKLQTKDLELTLEHNLRNNFDTYQLRLGLSGIANENLKTAKLNLQLAEDRYKNGSITSFDYRTLQITYLQTALNYYQSTFNLISDEVQLIKLAGGLLAIYK